MADKDQLNDREYYHGLKSYVDSVVYPDFPYSHVYAIKEVVEKIPSDSILHLSINDSIRITNFFKLNPRIKTYANIGTHGIDGCLSSFLGQAAAGDKQSYLVIGDLAFFYDMNAMRLRHIKNNVHILLINNEGGSEFYFNHMWKDEATILVIATVILGLDGIVNTLGKIGPIIIIMILFVSIFTAITGFPNYLANASDIDTGVYSTIVEQVGNGSPLMSGASYGGFVILWFASFLAEIGSKNKLSEVNVGMTLSAIFIFGAATVCCFALIGYIDVVGAADIPALVLAAHISPVLAQAFAVIICAGIYTSAVPLLWTGVRKISNEGTKKYKIVTVIAGVVGCLIACFVPYKGLINILYGMNGYLGFILVFFMIIYDVKTKMSKNIEVD